MLWKQVEMKNNGKGAFLIDLLEMVTFRLRPEDWEGPSNEGWKEETRPGRGCTKVLEACSQYTDRCLSHLLHVLGSHVLYTHTHNAWGSLNQDLSHYHASHIQKLSYTMCSFPSCYRKAVRNQAILQENFARFLVKVGISLQAMLLASSVIFTNIVSQV